MASENVVILMGNLTRDPEVREAGKTTVARLGLAINDYKDKVTFVDVTAFGKVAENCGKFLEKGAPVYVSGRLNLDSWTDKSSGERRSKLNVIANRVQFLGKAGAPVKAESAEEEDDFPF